MLKNNKTLVNINMNFILLFTRLSLVVFIIYESLIRDKVINIEIFQNYGNLSKFGLGDEEINSIYRSLYINSVGFFDKLNIYT